MRWLKQSRKNEQGAVAVTVALSLIPILACLALVVDVGVAYWEKGQLQNGADAAALAVAEDCIRDSALCSILAATPAAGEVAAVNANDTRANATVNQFTGDSTAGTAQVTATTRSSSGTTIWLPIISEAVSGEARASVTWGTPIRGPVLPFAIGECELNDARLLSGQEVVIESTNRSSCPLIGSPGGFGLLDNSTAPACEVTISATAWVQGDTGAGGSASLCTADLLRLRLCSTVLVPIFDASARNPDGTGGPPAGSNAYFHIQKFAAFVFDGFRFTGSEHGQCAGVPELFNTGSWPNTGIQGHFVRFVSLDEAFDLGPGGVSGGVVVVKMTE